MVYASSIHLNNNIDQLTTSNCPAEAIAHGYIGVSCSQLPPGRIHRYAPLLQSTTMRVHVRRPKQSMSFSHFHAACVCVCVCVNLDWFKAVINAFLLPFSIYCSGALNNDVRFNPKVHNSIHNIRAYICRRTCKVGEEYLANSCRAYPAHGQLVSLQ
jgi:hypothetical protein